MPIFFTQHGAGGLIGPEGLGLLVGAVQSRHQLSPEPFSERVSDRQVAHLGNNVGVSSEFEVGGDPVLQSDKPQLFEPSDLALGKTFVAEVLERPTSPQFQRLHQPLPGYLGVHSQRGGPLGGKLLKTMGIDLTPFDPQHIPAGCGADHPLVAPVTVGFQGVPELGDVIAQRLDATGGLPVAPHLFPKPIDGNHLVGVDQQHPEQRPWFASTDLNESTGDTDLEGTEDQELHGVRSSHPVLPDPAAAR
jgi:hypothetical protein